MTLHIAVDGVDAKEITYALYTYYKSKKYNAGLCKRTGDWFLNYIKRNYDLNNYQTALINALDESITYSLADFTGYDIIFWENSIIADYLTLIDEDVTRYWINQINNKTPKKDLYCYIKPNNETEKDKSVNYNGNMIILNDTGSMKTNLKELIKQINEYFPQCCWCNHIYKKDKHHIKYCSKTCSQLANQKQVRDRVNKYNKKYKNETPSSYHANLGSDALLKQHPNTDFEKEHKCIINEKRRQGLL